MSECWGRLVVGWQAISRSEDCWFFSIQLRRGTTRRLSANKNTESRTAEYSIRIQGGAAEIKNVSETIRSLRQGTTLYHSKTTGNISRNTDVASEREAISGVNHGIAIKGEFGYEPGHCARPSKKCSRRHCSRSLSLSLSGAWLWIESSITSSVHGPPTESSGKYSRTGFSTASGTTSSQTRCADGSRRRDTGLSHIIKERLHGVVQPT